MRSFKPQFSEPPWVEFIGALGEDCGCLCAPDCGSGAVAAIPSRAAAAFGGGKCCVRLGIAAKVKECTSTLPQNCSLDSLACLDVKQPVG